MIGNNLDWR